MADCSDQAEFEQLPDLYQRWVEALLPEGIPREGQATCFNCTMCHKGDAAPDEGVGFFNPVTKCCTYFPDVPNFLVGRAIAVDTPGAAALRAFVDSGSGTRTNVTLRSVQPVAKIATVYEHHRSQAFGHDAELLCPYAVTTDPDVGPMCGIWKQRNAVCSTWFCKHEKGVTGRTFWMALQGLLSHLEYAVSWWAILEVLDDPAAACSLAGTTVDSKITIGLRHDAWRHWKGSRASFYEACADRVDALSAQDAIAIAGVTGRLHQTELSTRFRKLLSDAVPDRLRVEPYRVVRQDPQRALLQASDSPEPFEAPSALLPLLAHFNGRPTDETIEAIREATRVRLTPGLLRRLYDFGILQEMPSDSSS